VSDRPTPLADTLSRFADRLFRTGGADPGDEAIAVPPERMEVYHQLLFGNYRTMLRFAYTATFRIIAYEAKRETVAPGVPGSIGEIIGAYLSTQPPDGHSTRLIADTFRPIFEERYPTFFARWPALAALMDVERAELRANYHWDDPGRGPEDGELQALTGASVGDLLAREVVRAPSSSTLRLDQPGATLRHRVMHRDFPAPDELTGAELVLVSRHAERLEPVIQVVDEATLLLHELAPPGTALAVEALAERWMSALPADLASADEATQLAALVQGVFAGLSAGALRFA